MDITESAVSHQLRSLRAARLVKSRKAGKHVYYSLSDDHVSWILKKTCEHIRER
jgi:DNA-binding transcriptional ArsR family regulator